MKAGTLVTHRFEDGTVNRIGVVLGPSNDYWGKVSEDWFYVQWTDGLLTTQTTHHVEVIDD